MMVADGLMAFWGGLVWIVSLLFDEKRGGLRELHVLRGFMVLFRLDVVLW